MSNIARMFVLKTSKRTQERAKSTLKRTMRSERENDV